MAQTFDEKHPNITREVKELDFDLHIAACESEIKQAINASLEPMPKSNEPESSVYRFNEILDAESTKSS